MKSYGQRMNASVTGWSRSRDRRLQAQLRIAGAAARADRRRRRCARPRDLTIGFARRFATYKRATLAVP